jgi:SAM-dependent methyltransferase
MVGMMKLTDLIQRILIKHIDPLTKSPELILLGYCSNETASEHLSRYLLASKFSRGVVLDVASGTCYGSSILKRVDNVEIVVSVDIDKDALEYGRIVYDADCVRADATHLPFRKHVFDSVVSLETLEHIRDQGAFLNNIKDCLKIGGKLILSTPNKMYTSPFLPKPLNPFHVNEFYLGSLLNFLKAYSFRIEHVYGGRRVKKLELLRRILGSLLKFFLSKVSLKPYLLDYLYRSVYSSILIRLWKRSERQHLIDPDPSLFMQYEEVKLRSNIVLYQYFLVCAHL